MVLSHCLLKGSDCLLSCDLKVIFVMFFLLSVVEEVKPLRRLHVQSLLDLQRHREGSREAREIDHI